VDIHWPLPKFELECPEYKADQNQHIAAAKKQ